MWPARPMKSFERIRETKVISLRAREDANILRGVVEGETNVSEARRVYGDEI